MIVPASLQVRHSLVRFRQNCQSANLLLSQPLYDGGHTHVPKGYELEAVEPSIRVDALSKHP